MSKPERRLRQTDIFVSPSRHARIFAGNNEVDHMFTEFCWGGCN